jgi:hypothetical protein
VPPPAANLQASGNTSWSYCLSTGECALNAALQNTGTGCASGTTATVKLYDAAGNQTGSDVGMAAVGGGLANKTIRPQEIVTLISSSMVPGYAVTAAKSYRLLPVWNNVVCP